MTYPVIVEPDNGQFSAKLLGDDRIVVVRPTRDEAVNALKHEVEQRVIRGELVFVDLPKPGAAAVIGMFADDPTLREIVDEIYAERDRERDELPE
ncbi:MAG: hypothetical protein HYV60_08530 [Planctomycetia bacterium]|nr:hypothetical protein [Planctomycetia bacterium]